MKREHQRRELESHVLGVEDCGITQGGGEEGGGGFSLRTTFLYYSGSAQILNLVDSDP